MNRLSLIERFDVRFLEIMFHPEPLALHAEMFAVNRAQQKHGHAASVTIFQKFFRVREHESRVAGTGLGLSICKQIIYGHGGRIEVKSKIGVGTVFSIFLPRSGKTQPRIEIDSEQKKINMKQ